MYISVGSDEQEEAECLAELWVETCLKIETNFRNFNDTVFTVSNNLYCKYYSKYLKSLLYFTFPSFFSHYSPGYIMQDQAQDFELFSWGNSDAKIPSFDADCLSIAAYLNCCQANWVINDCNDTSISPSGELPLLRDSMQALVGTSNIINHLKQKVCVIYLLLINLFLTRDSI